MTSFDRSKTDLIRDTVVEKSVLGSGKNDLIFFFIFLRRKKSELNDIFFDLRENLSFRYAVDGKGRVQNGVEVRVGFGG